jgi:hypothetical protein
MSAHRRIRPSADEFNPYYAGYVAQVPDGDVVEALIGGAEIASALLGDLDEAAASHAYAPGKWTLKEVLLHCTDAERIFAYRALRIALHAAPGIRRERLRAAQRRRESRHR